jgi:hypothetical protein
LHASAVEEVLVNKPLAGFIAAMAIIRAVEGIAGEATTQSTTTPSTSTSSSSSMRRDYENLILLGVYPARPIASMTVGVQANAYGWDDAYCTWFGPGAARINFQGPKTFSFASLPDGVFSRSQAVLLCSYYTHEPNGPLDEHDFRASIQARDEQESLVFTSICVLRFDEDHLPEPSIDDCRYACGDPYCDGGEPSVLDALTVLRGSVGLLPCGNYECDVNGDEKVQALDALFVLRSSVGLSQTLLCSSTPLRCY